MTISADMPARLVARASFRAAASALPPDMKTSDSARSSCSTAQPSPSGTTQMVTCRMAPFSRPFWFRASVSPSLVISVSGPALALTGEINFRCGARSVRGARSPAANRATEGLALPLSVTPEPPPELGGERVASPRWAKIDEPRRDRPVLGRGPGGVRTGAANPPTNAASRKALLLPVKTGHPGCVCHDDDQAERSCAVNP